MNRDDIEGMSRVEKTQGIAWLESLAARAQAEAEVLRDSLAVEAREQFKSDGTASTHRMPDLGRIQTSVTKGGVYVSDEKVFATWVAKHYPTEVETALRVNSAFQLSFLRRLDAEGDRVFDPKDGAQVLGVTYRPGGAFKGIAIYLDDAAKEVFGTLAGHALERLALEAGPAVPVVLAEVASVEA